MAKDLRPLTVSSGLPAAAALTRAPCCATASSTTPIPTGALLGAHQAQLPAAWRQLAVGETLYAKSAEPTPKEAVAAWLSSPAHREILASTQWRDVGIAVFRSASAGGAFGGGPPGS